MFEGFDPLRRKELFLCSQKKRNRILFFYKKSIVQQKLKISGEHNGRVNFSFHIVVVIVAG